MPTLNIIFDARRQEKYEPLMEELWLQGILDYEIWPCIMLPDIVQSINASHKMIVKYAKEKGLDECFIAEDDVMFPAEDGWQHFLRNKPNPKDYDLYLAATYTPPITNNIICGFHLYSVSSRFYDEFLLTPDTAHIDTEMNNIKGEWRFCYPMAAIQRPGFSANNKMKVNYNSVLLDGDVYGGLPK